MYSNVWYCIARLRSEGSLFVEPTNECTCNTGYGPAGGGHIYKHNCTNKSVWTRVLNANHHVKLSPIKRAVGAAWI